MKNIIIIYLRKKNMIIEWKLTQHKSRNKRSDEDQNYNCLWNIHQSHSPNLHLCLYFVQQLNFFFLINIFFRVNKGDEWMGVWGLDFCLFILLFKLA